MSKHCPSCYVLHTPDKCPTTKPSRTRTIERPYHAIAIKQVHGLPAAGKVRIVTKDTGGRAIYQLSTAGYLIAPAPLQSDAYSIDIVDESDPPSKLPIDLEFLFLPPQSRRVP